jgi:PHD/YefM family antitoxin component YafN of YafNO toxin-antitoxin module
MLARPPSRDKTPNELVGHICLEYALSMERIISVTDLVRNAARIAKEVETEGTVYRITRGGRGSMVLVDDEYFEGWMAAIDEMRRPDWRQVLAEGRRDATEGRGRTLEAVVKELGIEDSPKPARRAPARKPAPSRRKKGR